MKKLNFLFLLSFLLMTVCALAQEKFIPTIVREDNETIRAITKEVDPAGWLYFKDDIRLQATEFFTQHKAATGLKENDEMKIQKTWSDEYGEYRRYQQFYKGIKVYGAEFDEQIKGGRVEMAHGKIVEDLVVDVDHHISETEALESVLAKIAAKSYAWQNEEWEQSLKKELGNEKATYRPKGELMFYLVEGETLVKENYAFAWRFEVLAAEPSSFDEVVVDAASGNVLIVRSLTESNGPAQTVFNGVRVIDTQFNGTTNILRADNNGRNIHTKVDNGINLGTPANAFITRFTAVPDVLNATDNWTAAQSVPTSAHFGVSTAWDYFRNTFNRNGMDNTGGLVRTITGTGLVDNAFFFRDPVGRDFLTFGVQSISNIPLVALDICGHEFTHGITRATANLAGFNQPGALNESFSDIFGVMSERTVAGLNFTLGETVPGITRSLSSPQSLTTSCGTPPTIFQGAGWVQPGGCDAGGIHHNCSIQNLWFFLLSQGGSQNGVNVQPIGIDKAARIAFRNLTVNMMIQSNFPDARAGALNAAAALFGLCSNEYKQTMNAWAAVGLGSPFTAPTANFPNMVCPGVIPFDLNAYSLCTNDIFSWYFPNNWSFTSLNSNNSIIRVTSIGTISANTTATLAVSGSFSGQSYVNIAVNKKCSGATKTISNTGGINIFPNPALDKLQVQISNDFIDGYLHIYDVLGQEISSNPIQQTDTEIDVSTFNNGLYFCKIQKGEDCQVIKFTKF